MSNRFRIFPLSKDDLPVAPADPGGMRVAYLEAKTFKSKSDWPLVIASKDVLPLKPGALLDVGDIAALSFDGTRWWWMDREDGQTERGTDDDPGEFMKQFAQDLTGFTAGAISQSQIEKHFVMSGIVHSRGIVPSTDWTDDPGEEDGGWTDDPGEAGVDWTDDAGEEE